MKEVTVITGAALGFILLTSAQIFPKTRPQHSAGMGLRVLCTVQEVKDRQETILGIEEEIRKGIVTTVKLKEQISNLVLKPLRGALDFPQPDQHLPQ